MSKLYQMNRMRYSPAAGGILTNVIKGVGGVVGGLFKSKGAKAAAQIAKTAIKNPVVQGAAGAAGWLGAESLLSGGGKSSGVSGGWGTHRRRGITATELRGFHKVARLLHKEGMVVKHARRG